MAKCKQRGTPLQRERDFIAAVLDTVDALVVVLDTEGRIIQFNRACEELTGYSSEEVKGKRVWDLLLLPTEVDRVRAVFDDLRAGRLPNRFENYWVAKDGSRRLIAWSNTALLDPQGAVEHIIGTGIDITEWKRSEEALKETNRKVERLHEAAHRLESCKTEEDIYQLTVEAAEKILDFSMCTLDIVEGSKLVIKATSSRLPPGATRESDLESGGLAAKTYHTGKTYVFDNLDEVPEARPTREDFKSGISAPIGNIGVFQVASNEPGAFTWEDARLLDLLLGHTVEAIKRIRLEIELKEQAIHDPLTDAYNRYYLSQALEREASRAKRYGHSIAFLMIDVNRFKEINDRFGHQVGDKVLQAVASLLLETVRETDIVVRYGGDEFLIMLLETGGEAEVVKRRVLEKAACRSELHESVDFPVTLSIGSAHWSPEGSQSVEEVLAEADKRMYDDKRRQAADRSG